MFYYFNLIVHRNVDMILVYILYVSVVQQLVIYPALSTARWLNSKIKKIYIGSDDHPTSNAGGVLHVLCVRALVDYNGVLCKRVRVFVDKRVYFRLLLLSECPTIPICLWAGLQLRRWGTSPPGLTSQRGGEELYT